MAETLPPLLDLAHVSRHYRAGDTVVRALDDVTLRVYPGEFVAIMGQSGSGKSTLMNIIGCLDRATAGDYRVRGHDVSQLSGDDLAALRRETFGFIFQRYNLLATSSAQENVEIPAVYAGMTRAKRAERAKSLLTTLGLDDRTGHRPGALSGGQQQRVAIARALMNDPPLILADEPTGALDSRSGQEVIALLKDLNAQGRTVVLITHDEQVAAHARRIVRIADGKIVEDSGAQESTVPAPVPDEAPVAHGGRLITDAGEAMFTAIRALRVNLFRTALTLLGIVIGVAAVITMLAVGNGSKQSVLDQISSLGTNLLSIRPGAPGVRPSGDVATLTVDDTRAIANLANVVSVLPERTGGKTVRFGDTDYATQIQGTGYAFPAARDWPLAQGTFFTQDDQNGYAAVAVLGKTVADILFPLNDGVGKYVLIGNIPFEVIGVMTPKGAAPWGQDQDNVAMVPITTALTRLFGQNYLSNVTVKVADTKTITQTEDAITALLKGRHHIEDFQVRNTASFLQMATQTQNTLTILLGAVAAISLLVGGIGVMNIMLVSVTERTREIGIRMATGARMRDIMIQFNTEAAVVCTIGGVLGVALGLGAGWVLSMFGVNILFTLPPVVIAFTCAVATGLVFGYLPAAKAARLDPVIALSTE